MDITSVTSYRVARSRADLALRDGEVVIAGGTWLMSEPQPGTTGFVDLTGLDWPDLEVSEEGLRIGATCTIARLLAWVEHEAPPAWTSLALARPAADALLASFKIWNTATVGGNVCQAFAAGAMIALLSTLDATALVWTPDGGERRIAVADLVIDNAATSLAPGRSCAPSTSRCAPSPRRSDCARSPWPSSVARVRWSPPASIPTDRACSS